MIKSFVLQQDQEVSQRLKPRFLSPPACATKLFTDVMEQKVLRHQWMKTTVLSCHKCLSNTGVEKMNNI